MSVFNLMITELCLFQTRYPHSFFLNKWPSGIPRIDLFCWEKPGTEMENCLLGKMRYCTAAETNINEIVIFLAIGIH